MPYNKANYQIDVTADLVSNRSEFIRGDNSNCLLQLTHE